VDREVLKIPDYEAKRREFFAYYDQNRELFSSIEGAVLSLTKLLIEQSDIKGTKILSRIKEKNECVRKFDLKYRTESEKSKEDYDIKDKIGDIIGIRIICLYESDIPKVVDLIKQEFKVEKIENKSADLNEKVKFGYKGTHVDVKISSERAKLTEYKRFDGVRVELQVRSIVQDAWSEVDHRLKYKKQIPEKIKRRIIRLAALFELADQEFEEIRRQTEERERELAFGDQKNKNLESIDNTSNKEHANDDTLDSFSFLNFVQPRYKAYNFEPIKVDGFVDEIKYMDPTMNLTKFADIFNKQFDITHKYRTNRREIGININPFTHMRHMLYLHDQIKFADMLYPSQREGFREWVSQNAVDIERPSK